MSHAEKKSPNTHPQDALQKGLEFAVVFKDGISISLGFPSNVHPGKLTWNPKITGLKGNSSKTSTSMTLGNFP